MHVAQLISEVIYYLLGSHPQDTQWTRRSPIGPWGFHLWLRASVGSTECLSPPVRSLGTLLAGPSSLSIVPPGKRRVRHHTSLETASSGRQTYRHHLHSPPQLIYKGWSVAYDTWPTDRRPTTGAGTRPVIDKSFLCVRLTTIKKHC